MWDFNKKFNISEMILQNTMDYIIVVITIVIHIMSGVQCSR